jgi:hypothetical protein
MLAVSATNRGGIVGYFICRKDWNRLQRSAATQPSRTNLLQTEVCVVLLQPAQAQGKRRSQDLRNVTLQPCTQQQQFTKNQ